MLSGGPIEWLIFGLEKVDPKIRLIAELNEKMAYKPWIINKDDITFLVKGNPNWTMPPSFVAKAGIDLLPLSAILVATLFIEDAACPL